MEIGSAPTRSLRLSAPELAKLLEHRREHILSSLTDHQQMSVPSAMKNLDNVIELLGLFEHLTLSQHANAGQASWTIRLTPAVKSQGSGARKAAPDS